MNKRLLFYFPSLALVSLLSIFFGLGKFQILSVTIFSAIALGSVVFWRWRVPLAFVGVAALLASGLISVSYLLESTGFEIILFLVGMMIVVAFLEERRFFEILIYKTVPFFGYSANRLVITMLLLSALFAALVNEVTSILFMSAVMIHLTGRYRVNPVPFIIMQVFATNIGSGATAIGNPVGVVIAFKSGISFGEFLRWASPTSILALVVAIPLIMGFFRKDIRQLGISMKEQVLSDISPTDAQPLSRSEFLVPLGFFLGTIILLALHNQIEVLLNLPKNTLLFGFPLGAAGIALILERNKAREIVEVRVDWWTLLFLILFFGAVGSLSFTGTTTFLSLKLLLWAGLDMVKLLVSLAAVTSFLSSSINNILAVATIVPIVQGLQAVGTLVGVFTYPLWWVVLFAGIFFGNLTIIGSTVNIIAVGTIRRRKLGDLTVLQWIKPGLLASFPLLIIALILVYLQIPNMPWW